MSADYQSFGFNISDCEKICSANPNCTHFLFNWTNVICLYGNINEFYYKNYSINNLEQQFELFVKEGAENLYMNVGTGDMDVSNCNN